MHDISGFLCIYWSQLQEYLESTELDTEKGSKLLRSSTLIQRMAAAGTKMYEDFNPSTETVHEKECDIILLFLPGFKKEKLRVQVTSTNFLRLSGEREIDDSKYFRFQKEFPITPNIDTNRITAKFEQGILYVRLPYLITPEDKPHNKLPVPQPPKSMAPAEKPRTQTNAQQQKTSRSDGSNKQATVQDVPQKTIEKDEAQAKNEKSSKTVDSGSLGQKFQEEKRENNATIAGKGSNENVDGSGKRRPDNYVGTAVDAATKLKISRRSFYAVLVGLAAVGLGLYVTNFIRSFRTSEISG